MGEGGNTDGGVHGNLMSSKIIINRFSSYHDIWFHDVISRCPILVLQYSLSLIYIYMQD